MSEEQLKETSESAGRPDSNVADAEQLATQISEMLDAKKAEEILLLDLRDVNPYFSFFLLANAGSQIHLKSLMREILKTYSQYLPSHGGGYRPDDAESGWVVIDFIDLVVHLFEPEQRKFYNLERLWGDSRIVRGGEEA